MEGKTLRGVLEAFDHCVEKHPEYVETLPGALGIITEELGEVASDVNDYLETGLPTHLGNAKHELLQLAASAVRMYENIDKLEAIQ